MIGHSFQLNPFQNSLNFEVSSTMAKKGTKLRQQFKLEFIGKETVPIGNHY